MYQKKILAIFLLQAFLCIKARRFEDCGPKYELERRLEEVRASLEEVQHIESHINGKLHDLMLELDIESEQSENDSLKSANGSSATNCAYTHRHGVQHIQIDANSKAFEVLCDQEFAGGGWTVVLQRMHGHLDFTNRSRHEYKNGFGNLSDEFFIGLNKLHALTYTKPHEVLFILNQRRRYNRTINYDFFMVENVHKDFEVIMHGGSDIEEEMTFGTNKFCSNDKHKHCSNYTIPGWNSINNKCHLFGMHIRERMANERSVLCWNAKDEGDDECEPLLSIAMLIRPIDRFFQY